MNIYTYGAFLPGNRGNHINIPDGTKEYIERRHGEPFRFLFLPKMSLLGSKASTSKKSIIMNYKLIS